MIISAWNTIKHRRHLAMVKERIEMAISETKFEDGDKLFIDLGTSITIEEIYGMEIGVDVAHLYKGLYVMEW